MLSLFRKPKPLSENLPGFFSAMRQCQDEYFVIETRLSDLRRFKKHFETLHAKGKQATYDPNWVDVHGGFEGACQVKLPAGHYVAHCELSNRALIIHASKHGVGVVS